MISWTAAGRSHVGRERERNEDAFRVDAGRGVFVVADGMGGHAAGDVASRLATRVLGEALAGAVEGGGDPEEALASGLLSAQGAIRRKISQAPSLREMGTTVTACVLRPSGGFWIGQLGDSRAYLWRSGRLELITHDHTWVQREIDRGRLRAEQAESHPQSSLLLRVLSADLPAEPDLLSGELYPGDVLLLASDGLTRMIPDQEIERTLAGSGSLEEHASKLIDAANAAGGRDNVTVILVKIREGNSGPDALPVGAEEASVSPAPAWGRSGAAPP
ncbi:MAG: PP2C family protein-serine/threonine phosphatase [Longimicrobiaceae bacterium]